MLVLIALQVAAQANGFDLAEVKRPAAVTLVPPGRCAASPDSDEIVICGSRRGDERFRVPPSDTSSQPGARHRGDAPSAMAGITSTAPCGIFEGQRRCNKKEMEEAGYGGGRDPITVFGKVLGAVIDPDD